jgi:integrase
MPRGTPRTPAYCLHRATGRAVVRIDGRDYYLGAHGSPESRRRYDALIAEWLANGRRLAARPATLASDATTGGASAPPSATAGLSVNELLLAYDRWAEGYYRDADGQPARELDNIREAIKPLRRLYGLSPAAAFGPLQLRALQDDLVRSKLARTTVNQRIARVRRAFKWAVSFGLLSPVVFQALGTVPGLRRGRTAAREAPAVQPVASADVEAALPFMPPPVAALVQMQLLTGMRAGEAMALRDADVDTSGPVWCYRPHRHKNTHRGKDRTVFLGPKAQAVLRPWLRHRCPLCGVEGLPPMIGWQTETCGPCHDRHEEAGGGPLPDPPSPLVAADPAAPRHLFSPRACVEALHARRAAARKTPRTPSELKKTRKARPQVQPGERYTRRSYRLAVDRACRRAGVPPWSPLQLRHTAATAIRAQYGVEAARTILGHSRVETSQIYAEADLGRAARIMGEVG